MTKLHWSMRSSATGAGERCARGRAKIMTPLPFSPTVNLSPTRPKSFGERWKAGPAALILRAYSQAKMTRINEMIKEALDCLTHSPHQDLRKFIENSMENILTDVRVWRVSSMIYTRQQSTSPAVTSIDLSGNRCCTRRLWPLLTALVKYQSAEVN